MKKSLLLMSFMAAGMAMNAADFVAPEFYENASFQAISSNGNWIVSEVYGAVQIFDLTTGVVYTYEGDGYTTEYSVGVGNCVSDNGIVLGATSYDGPPAYWENGQWKLLDVEGATGSTHLANAITPDGSRICGLIGTTEISIDSDALMCIPAVWDRNPDGTYGKYTILPYPTSDLVGRVPQYVTAVQISDDGKVVAGQVRDCRGMLNYPIIYTQGEDGEWTYTLPVGDLYHPEGLVMPEYPGDSPATVQSMDYMSDDEWAAYNAAYQEWASNGYEGDMPVATDFMTEENLAAYTEAKEAWEAAMAEWRPKYEAWDDAYYELLESSPEFGFNDVCLTPDGKTYLSTAEIVVEDPMAWFGYSYAGQPWMVNLTDDTATHIDSEESMYLSYVSNNDVYFATNGLGQQQPLGYVIEDGVATGLYDWLAAKSPELKEWMDENLLRELESYEWDEDLQDWIVAVDEMLCTGIAIASSDLRTLAFWSDAPWDNMLYAEGCIVDLGQLSGVKDVVVAGKNRISFNADGSLAVDGDVEAVNVYDLQGRQVFSSKVVDGAAMSNNLSNGIYIIRAYTSDGSSFASKISK